MIAPALMSDQPPEITTMHPEIGIPAGKVKLICVGAVPTIGCLTIFVCGKKQFAYTRDRSRLKGLDWRAEQSFDDLLKKEWFRFELSSEVAIATSDFCNELGVDWGRLDLMDDGLEMTFLEFNANGQWVFLDYSGDDGLVKSVVNYLMPEVLN